MFRHCGGYGFDFSFAVPVIGGNKKEERLPKASDCERLAAFEASVCMGDQIWRMGTTLLAITSSGNTSGAE